MLLPTFDRRSPAAYSSTRADSCKGVTAYALAWLRLELKLVEYALAKRKYRPDQVRVPAGNPDGGQWTDGGSGRAAETVDNFRQLVEYSFGSLIAEYETGLGRRCVYRFGFGTVIVPGPDKFLCSRRVPSSAVTHGHFLNDN